MTARRLIVALFGAAALGVSVVGAGAALGTRAGGPVATPVGHANHLKPYKCKAQACAVIAADGTLIGTHPGVGTVTNPAPGHYCVQLTKIDVSGDPVVALTPIFSRSPGSHFDLQVFGHCDTNAIEIQNWPAGATAPQNVSFYFAVL